jgi:hypothetical protein
VLIRGKVRSTDCKNSWYMSVMPSIDSSSRAGSFSTFVMKEAFQSPTLILRRLTALTCSSIWGRIPPRIHVVLASVSRIAEPISSISVSNSTLNPRLLSVYTSNLATLRKRSRIKATIDSSSDYSARCSIIDELSRPLSQSVYKSTTSCRIAISTFSRSLGLRFCFCRIFWCGNCRSIAMYRSKRRYSGLETSVRR